MAYDVLTTPTFEGRLNQAVAWRVENVGTRSAARLLDDIDRVMERLAAFPASGADARTRTPEGLPLRWAMAGSYVVAYVIHEEERAVQLVDLFHDGEDWRRRLSERAG